MMLRNLSLFTGSGMCDLAAANAGIKTVAQCESDPCCLFCLDKLWPTTVKFTDVCDVSNDALGSRGCLPIDIISGGFPCQDISTAGKGEGIQGKRSGLWYEMLRVIDEVRPTWVLAENVPALRVRGSDEVLAGLEEIGYTCWPIVVGAWAVGAPHKRDRVWIIGRLADSSEDRWRDGRERRASSQDCIWSNIPPREDIGDQRWIIESTRLGASGFGLADANETGRQKRVRLGRDNGTERQTTLGNRWPSRPGKPQHEWEARRVVESGVGPFTDGLARELLRRLGFGDDRIPSARALRRVAKNVEGYARKATLRALGNSWVPHVPELIYRWIVEVTERQ